MRRLSAVLALAAVARLSLGGVTAMCTPLGDRALDHPDHGMSSASVQSRGDDASCERGGPDCSDARPDQCAAMSPCANVMNVAGLARAGNTATPERASAFVVNRPVDPSRAPEPPPPRI
jgi:hypothetical protein